MDIKPSFTLGDAFEKELNARKTDVSASFMNGLDTCPYTPKNIAASAEGAWDDITTNATAAWENLENGWKAGIDAWTGVNLQKQLFDKIWNYIESDIEEYVTFKTEEFFTATASLTVWGAERVVYWTAYYVGQEVKKAVDKFYSDPDIQAQKEAEDAEKAAMQEKIQKTLQKAQEIKDLVAGTTQEVYSAIQEITSVMSAGPDYIVDNVNKLYDKSVTPLKMQIDKMTKKGIDKGAQALGYWIAKKTADITAKVTEALLKTANKVKTAAKSAAKTAIDIVKQKIKGMTGG